MPIRLISLFGTRYFIVYTLAPPSIEEMQELGWRGATDRQLRAFVEGVESLQVSFKTLPSDANVTFDGPLAGGPNQSLSSDVGPFTGLVDTSGELPSGQEITIRDIRTGNSVTVTMSAYQMSVMLPNTTEHHSTLQSVPQHSSSLGSGAGNAALNDEGDFDDHGAVSSTQDNDLGLYTIEPDIASATTYEGSQRPGSQPTHRGSS
ncbi:hypothetical protein BCR39DRAFT_537596 [Naematelia encephala]|uniref:Uncharacterized protein n=1 Tax=Naematelia encephala TaxID=71784 RepID=A0A1Y2B0P0_9TREE|nr:hypothetical protein BCR39DRAFT_537596 [Naematelia encephala]